MRKKLLTTDSTLCGYIIMPVVCTLYGYQDSALNHMAVLLGPSSNMRLGVRSLVYAVLCANMYAFLICLNGSKIPV